MSDNELLSIENIQSRIYSIRGFYVMLDRDIAVCYGVEVRRLNEQVKRNKGRFPQSFCFQLTESEFANLKSQIAISSWGGRRTMPYAFTEQGVAMLSAVLKTDTAVEMSVKIIDAFVAMRRFILANAQIFQRLDTLELKQLETDQKIDKVIKVIESREIQPKQGIFYDGQIFDAYIFISDLFKSAENSIIIIDNYLDDSVLTLLTKRKKDVKVDLYTKNPSKALIQDVQKFNEEYSPIELRDFQSAHDRFIIIDETDLYHLGASLKDLGKKWFAFSKMDIGAVDMLSKLKEGN